MADRTTRFVVVFDYDRKVSDLDGRCLAVKF